MNDVVEQLRRRSQRHSHDRVYDDQDRQLDVMAMEEIERLRSIAGVAAVGPSFAEITQDLPRRSGESD